MSVPSHIGIPGNEKAASKAKIATSSPLSKEKKNKFNNTIRDTEYYPNQSQRKMGETLDQQTPFKQTQIYKIQYQTLDIPPRYH